jgi:hypothetical protein
MLLRLRPRSQFARKSQRLLQLSIIGCIPQSPFDFGNSIPISSLSEMFPYLRKCLADKPLSVCVRDVEGEAR